MVPIRYAGESAERSLSREALALGAVAGVASTLGRAQDRSWQPTGRRECPRECHPHGGARHPAHPPGTPVEAAAARR